MIRLSIIVPFYNVEKYIEQCIRSLYDQDIPKEEYEVICVDDCSPDGSRAIVERLQKEYPNLQLLIHERNKKLGGARNTGLKAAKGEYIWFVDSDDYIRPNVLLRLLTILDENKLDFVHFDFDEYFSDGRIKKQPFMETTPVLTGKELFYHPKFRWHINHVIVWQKIFRREFLVDNNIWFAENIMYEDVDYAFLTYPRAKRVMHIADHIYIYGSNDTSITRTRPSLKHVAYHLDICNRVDRLIRDSKKKGIDSDFVETMKQLIRNTYYRSLSFYMCLPDNDKKAAIGVYRDKIGWRLLPYMSLRNFFCFKIGLLRKIPNI